MSAKKETEQTLLDQIKNDVAKENKFNNWDDLDSTEIHRDMEFKYWPIVCERYATAKAKASCEATLKKASENAIIKTLSPCVDGCVKAMACSGRCTESYPVVVKSSITDPSNIICYDPKECMQFGCQYPGPIESSEPQEKEWQATPAKKKPLSERLEDISRKIRERKATKIEEIELFEAYKLGKHENVSAPSESQEEIWKKHIQQEELWDDAISIGESEKSRKFTIHKIMKYFTITRNP